MPDLRPLRPGDPERIGDHRLVGVLGSGGQGVVYRGVTGSGREVAIKLLHAHLVQDDAIARGFLREAEAARRVAAFCTAAVLDVGVLDERPYIVSEYVPGDTLYAAVRASGPRRGGALDRLAISTLTALAAIHQAGIVHRDFKPGNVLIGPDGPIVIDFGIAKALDATSRTSGAVGTPAYMSPEQFRGERVGTASDVFSWAGTMVFAATGRPPFAGDSVPVIMNAILTGTPDLSGVPGRLMRELIERCLAKDPVQRPQPTDLLRRLIGPAGAAASVPAPTSPPPSSPDTAPSSQAPSSRAASSQAAPSQTASSQAASAPPSDATQVPMSHAASPDAPPPPPSHGESAPSSRAAPASPSHGAPAPASHAAPGSPGRVDAGAPPLPPSGARPAQDAAPSQGRP
ncbi:serine/threonine-protein kinase, partial [Nonomuraea sp. NPDC049709]|uniref:serine/threonine-protein kinase n=1 Tax=Nonomuraea sp. NPDC049709 TaxID=3154736 RepID=UPI003442B766